MGGQSRKRGFGIGDLRSAGRHGFADAIQQVFELKLSQGHDKATPAMAHPRRGLLLSRSAHC
jgi:hypothetical protein